MLSPFLTASIFYWKWKQILWKMVTFYTGSETTNNKAQKICAKFLASWDNSWVVSVWPIYFAFVSLYLLCLRCLCVCAAAKKRGDTKKEQATESVGSICDALWVRHCFALRLRKQQQTWNEIYWCRGHDFNVQNFVTLTHARIGTKFLHTHRQDKIK